MARAALFLTAFLFLGARTISTGFASNDFLISADRIGDIKLCSKLSDLNGTHKSIEEIQEEAPEDDRLSWPAKRIRLSKGEWIYAEASWMDKTRIHRLSTNSKRYKTVDGYRIGDTLDALKRNQHLKSYSESARSFEAKTTRMEFGFDIEREKANAFYEKMGKLGHPKNWRDLVPQLSHIESITIVGCTQSASPTP